jgi:hypothetical protein
VTSAGAAIVQIAEHGNRERLTAVIGPYPGIIASDRWPGDEHLDPEQRQVWPALWTFTTHASVEPTSNPAERALRGPVIHRKLSHGTRSNAGERFAERVLSAAATCRLQDRSLLTYLRELITAHTRGDPFPALI